MRKHLVVLIGVAVVVVAGFASTAVAAPNGQKIGQDPIRLALTRCSQAGGGNTLEVFGTVPFQPSDVIRDDCLGHARGTFFSQAETLAIRDMAGGQFCMIGPINTCPGGHPPTQGCWFIGGFSGVGVVTCEIDPGNSGAHNSAGRLPVELPLPTGP